MGLSQAKLGVAMGLPEDVASTRINRYERLTSEPTVDEIRALAKALGVPPAALLADSDDLVSVIIGFAKLPKRGQRQALKGILDALGPERAELVVACAKGTPPADKPASRRAAKQSASKRAAKKRSTRHAAS